METPVNKIVNTYMSCALSQVIRCKTKDNSWRWWCE